MSFYCVNSPIITNVPKEIGTLNLRYKYIIYSLNSSK